MHIDEKKTKHLLQFYRYYLMYKIIQIKRECVPSTTLQGRKTSFVSKRAGRIMDGRIQLCIHTKRAPNSNNCALRIEIF